MKPTSKNKQQKTTVNIFSVNHIVVKGLVAELKKCSLPTLGKHKRHENIEPFCLYKTQFRYLHGQEMDHKVQERAKINKGLKKNLCPICTDPEIFVACL